MARTSMLLQLLERGSARRILEARPRRELGIAVDLVNYPFLAIVGQHEMKLALILAVVNPRVGGVLLIGPRGTGKTTAVRGLVDLLPPVERSLCPYGCEPEAAYARGIDAICPQCAEKLARGEPLTAPDRMRLIELPLNARLEDVVGGINERIALEQKRVRVDRGILSLADRNILYVDEINLLDDAIVNAILDAAAQGHYTVHRGPLTAVYYSRFVLIGSMNPEEGRLRPQIMDRMGLRVVVGGLKDPKERLEVYRRMRSFAENPHEMLAAYADESAALSEEIAEARERLKRVQLTRQAELLALRLVQELKIDSHRAEYVMLEAARAHAAADGREKATVRDVRAVAPMALRQRRSAFMSRYLERIEQEDREILETLDRLR